MSKISDPEGAKRVNNRAGDKVPKISGRENLLSNEPTVVTGTMMYDGGLQTFFSILIISRQWPHFSESRRGQVNWSKSHSW